LLKRCRDADSVGFDVRVLHTPSGPIVEVINPPGGPQAPLDPIQPPPVASLSALLDHDYEFKEQQVK